LGEITVFLFILFMGFLYAHKKGAVEMDVTENVGKTDSFPVVFTRHPAAELW